MRDRGISRKQLLEHLGWSKGGLANLLNLTYPSARDSMLDQVEDVITKSFPLRQETP